MSRLLLVLVLAAPLAGCGDAAPTTAPSKAPSASEMFDKGKAPANPVGAAPKAGPKGG